MRRTQNKREWRAKDQILISLYFTVGNKSFLWSGTSGGNHIVKRFAGVNYEGAVVAGGYEPLTHLAGVEQLLELSHHHIILLHSLT